MKNETHFDGADYKHDRDSGRLLTQRDQIRLYMEKRDYVTLQEIADATGHPHSSVSAQLRNLRKERFGGYTVDRKHISNGLYAYKLSW